MNLDSLPEVFNLKDIEPEEAFKLGVDFGSIYRWLWDRGSGQKRLPLILWPLAVDAATRRGVVVTADGWAEPGQSTDILISARTPI